MNPALTQSRQLELISLLPSVMTNRNRCGVAFDGKAQMDRRVSLDHIGRS
jgi:hypothetical protein